VSEPLTIERPRADHAVADLDCGPVALSGSTVVGYDSLAVGKLAYEGLLVD
jgi:hypothetical protein